MKNTILLITALLVLASCSGVERDRTRLCKMLDTCDQPSE